jgi:magnesium-protoporphyrin O-methyltransferase
MADSYTATRERLTTYFDRTAAKTWAQLTSDAPVSRIRQTVRAGRDEMRGILLGCLPEDLRGARVLDAGCGVGGLSAALAERGATVVGIDISPNLLEVARDRTPSALKPQIRFEAGDMLDPSWGAFDYVVAMDSLIHYTPADIAAALAKLRGRSREAVIFTVAPKTPLLSAMHIAGKAFPRKDRSPAIVPQSIPRLERELHKFAEMKQAALTEVGRVSTGFYKSQAMELR